MILICDKCYKVYGCRPTYHPLDNMMGKLCISCEVDMFCEAIGKNFETLGNVGDVKIEGYCLDCIGRGGGL